MWLLSLVTLAGDLGKPVKTLRLISNEISQATVALMQFSPGIISMGQRGAGVARASRHLFPKLAKPNKRQSSDQGQTNRGNNDKGFSRWKGKERGRLTGNERMETEVSSRVFLCRTRTTLLFLSSFSFFFLMYTTFLATRASSLKISKRTARFF